MTKCQQAPGALALTLCLLVCSQAGLAQKQVAPLLEHEIGAALPNAPKPQDQPPSNFSSVTPQNNATPLVARKYAQVIEAGQTAQQLFFGSKMVLAMRMTIRPINLLPNVFWAGVGQGIDSNPKYGSDSGAFAARFGAEVAHAASTRLLEGFYAAALHQDFRYYRVSNGSVMHRVGLSVEQVALRRGDDGAEQFNYSGVAARASSAALAMAYYAPVSRTTGVALSTWGFSEVTAAGGNLILEFWPDAAHKFPFLKKLEIK